MPALLDRSLRGIPVLCALAAGAIVALAAQSAMAQSATGSVSGRVLWGSCLRGIPLPMAPDVQGQGQGQALPATSVAPDMPTADAQIQPVPAPGQPSRPVPAPINGLPAGAVLVAVQNTAVSARTDEAGRFSLSGVPAGQYMTVAAGPVANAFSATAQRPNVLVTGGQNVDIGTLALGGPSPYGIACGFPFAPADATPGDTQTGP